MAEPCPEEGCGKHRTSVKTLFRGGTCILLTAFASAGVVHVARIIRDRYGQQLRQFLSSHSSGTRAGRR
jgi:hypothetical protein